jgi:hypothetical protein
MKTMKMICAGLTGILFVFLFAPVAPAENLLDGRDPGFESSTPNGKYPDSGYWQMGWLGEAGAVCTSTAAYTGGAGLWEYTGTSGTDWWSGQYQDISANPGETFTGSAWVESQYTWVSGSKALVRLAFLDASHNVLATKDSPAITAASCDWQPLTGQTDSAPAGTAFIRFRLYLEKPNGLSGQSIATFDDCSLERAAPQPQLSVNPSVLGYGNDLVTLSFGITNSGAGTVSWTITKNADWIGVSPASGSTTTETDTVTVTVNRSGLKLSDYSSALVVTSNGGNKDVDVIMEIPPATAVPAAPAIVAVSGYRLMVRRRLPDGTLDVARPYTIKGAAWDPAGIGTTSGYSSRRAEFGNWYRLDLQLLKEMSANTVYLFLDPGTDPTMINTARAVLDYCYQNGVMVIMTVDEDGTDNSANIAQVMNAFKNHPAILMWALGNEWNLLRPDKQLYYEHYSTLAAAAAAMQTNALQVQSLDANHPVASILGEINNPTPAEVDSIVNNICTAVDVWGANIYRGPEFYALFTEWKNMASKPLFLSEFGTDAFHSTSWWPVVGYEDQAAQANYTNTLWFDMAQELSADDTAKVCLGGTVFEWNDEWWKTATGSPSVHDPGGYVTTWNPNAHPDGFANEEWFGIVSVGRERRRAYYKLQYQYQPGISVIDSGDFNGDGTSDIAVFRGSSGTWSVRNITRVYFGSSADFLVPGDYKGDGTTDVAVFRDSSGLWSVRDLTRFYLGSNGDVPVPGDYDGDGAAEAGLFRQSAGLWSIRNLSRVYFGFTGDRAVPGHYDAGSVKDIAVFRDSAGMWSVRDITRFYFGSATDDLVPGDYGGAGKWEGGIFRSSTGFWSIRNVTRFYLGTSTDRPLPADYDGDGIDEEGIFRDSNGMWSVRDLTRVYFGTTGDSPVTR